MNPMTQNKYTPETLDKSFIIPLYQRLFEWEDVQVLQLLHDLYSSYKKAPESPYYIGMLTAFKGNGEERYSLVDGQQRFTVLTLMGIVFGWKAFLTVGDNLRLSFFARKNDEEYLKCLVTLPNDVQPLGYENKKMKAAIACIEKFINGKEDVKIFQKYVFEQTTFFVSELPDTYNLQDLNRYFEAMNEAGKGLENHEILKVILLKKVASHNYDKYTTIWNSVSEMDKCIVKQKENEKQEDYKRKNVNIFKETTFEKVFKNDAISVIGKDIKSLKAIDATHKKPSEALLERSEKAILTFTDFLLQVLWISLKKENRHNATDFFNRNKLLETFDKHIKSDEKNESVDVDDFFTNLLKFRVLFDYYIIRLNSSDERNVTYSLNQVSEESNNESKRSLIQYQSMLYVSTESHIWLTAFLEELADKKEVTTDSALVFLQKWDNERQNVDISLNYGSINRYWFWRLDYYLWANRSTHFRAGEEEIADKYIFRSNRSIEHIAPQTPKTESQVKFDESLLHIFGNLAMISAGQNSSLQNESFEVKKAYVQSFINKSVGGSIQSLKMLNIYRYNTWSKVEIKKHHNKMIQILIESFKYDDIKYGKIIEALEGQKIPPN
jgi:hypothetical protein